MSWWLLNCVGALSENQAARKPAKSQVHEEDIRVLSMLPLSLRQDLNSEV